MIPLNEGEKRLPLFDKLPKCHRNDPATSSEAAKRIRRSGKLRTQRQRTLEALRVCNGATHAELGLSMGVHWLIPARRLSELERFGYVRKGQARICRVKGTRCTTWWINDTEKLEGN